MQNLEKFIVKIPHKVEKTSFLTKEKPFWLKRAQKSPKRPKKGQMRYFIEKRLSYQFSFMEIQLLKKKVRFSRYAVTYTHTDRHTRVVL